MRAMRRVASGDGVSIAVHDLGGARSSEVLLVCHATGFCGRAYQALGDELSDRFHVLALDFEGHGDSSARPDGTVDWGAMAGDLLAVVDAVSDGSPVAAFGHSLGGGILMLAELARPGTLRAAHLFEPIVLPPGWRGGEGGEPLAESARRRRSVFSSRADALYRYASRPPLNVLQAGSLVAYVEHGMEELEDGSVRLKCSPEHEAATFEGTGKPTFTDLSAVSTPVTVAVGTTERGWTPAVLGPSIVAALPNGRLERHPLLGHFGPLQGPATVGAMVLEALGS